jgi:hypothetical protein
VTTPTTGDNISRGCGDSIRFGRFQPQRTTQLSKPFRQAALARGFAPVADSNAEHTDLFALGDDLGFGPRSWLLLVLAVIRLAHVHVNMMRWFHRKRKAP